jgi:hypothetical protein
MTYYRTPIAVAIPLLLIVSLAASQVQHSPAFESMDRKVEILEANAQRPPSQPQITDIAQRELNAYIAEGGVDLPKGVHDVKAYFEPAIVHATATVDFDTLAAGHTGGNPIFSALFNGTHDVEAQAQASGARGQGTVIIDWVKLDGIEIPRAALEYLVQHYVQPKYPNAGMTTKFALPLQIDMAVVSRGKVTLTQK